MCPPTADSSRVFVGSRCRALKHLIRVPREVLPSSGRIAPAASTTTASPMRRSQVALERVAREILELAERLDPGEPAADEHEHRAPPAVQGVVGLGRDIEPGQHAVAGQIASCTVLKPTPCSARPGIRARGPTRREHDDVVQELGRAAVGEHPG